MSFALLPGHVDLKAELKASRWSESDDRANIEILPSFRLPEKLHNTCFRIPLSGGTFQYLCVLKGVAFSLF